MSSGTRQEGSAIVEETSPVKVKQRKQWLAGLFSKEDATSNTNKTGAPSPNKSELVLSRHEWLIEQEKKRRQKSIDENAIPNSAARRISAGEPSSWSSPSRMQKRQDATGDSPPGSPQLHHLQYSSPDDHFQLNNNNNDSDTIPVTSSALSDRAETVDSLDFTDREELGTGRKRDHNHNPNNNAHHSLLAADHCSMIGLAQLEVADSLFLGYARRNIQSVEEAKEFLEQVKRQHPDACHVPFAYQIVRNNNGGEMNDNNNSNNSTIEQDQDDDGEPPHSHTAQVLLDQVQATIQDLQLHHSNALLFAEESGCRVLGMVLVIVRYFGGSHLLGVTCGRLPQCYQRVAQLTLHRLIKGSHIPHVLDLTTVRTNNDDTEANQHQQQSSATPQPQHVYGLAAGDTELHVDVVTDEYPAQSRHEIVQLLLQELDFGGFQGAKGEVLPRLQNLQADFLSPSDFDSEESNNVFPFPATSNDAKPCIVPMYRYPGNYHGDQWETFPWSPTSWKLKEQVEEALPAYYGGQRMNHCVTNYYRNGADHIAHHSDKDLDLNRTAAIVSLSLGSERILELRQRKDPKDVTRVLLPHGSMLVLGPRTNRLFTHSILPVEPSTGTGEKKSEMESLRADSNDALAALDDVRLSLTMRHVVTYMDLPTKRLFGQGVDKSFAEVRKSIWLERGVFVLGFSSLWGLWMTNRSGLHQRHATKSSWSVFPESVTLLGTVGLTWWSYSSARRAYHKQRDEIAARSFFTQMSAQGTKY